MNASQLKKIAAEKLLEANRLVSAAEDILSQVDERGFQVCSRAISSANSDIATVRFALCGDRASISQLGI